MPKKSTKTDPKKDSKKIAKPESGKVVDGEKPVFYITREGLEKLKKDLKEHKEVRRKEVSKRIKEAIAFGDLSENDEYKEAKNEQAFIEGFIIEAEYKIKNAVIIDKSEDKSIVQIGSKVVIKNAEEKESKEEEYSIVGFMEADPLNGKISTESPVGRAIFGKKAGEKVKVNAPAGTFEYKIVKIK